VLTYTFGTQSSSGVAQTSMNTSGLGASGNLNAPFGAAGDTLSSFATSLVSSQAQQSAATTNKLTTEQALQSSLSAKVATVSGVNMDTELSQMLTLQNAYGANARIMAGIQSMFTALLQAVQ
jgi:flagellar hook-associated protein 1 FlgK